MKLQIECRLLPNPGSFEEAMEGNPGTQQLAPTPLQQRGFERVVEYHVACYR